MKMLEDHGSFDGRQQVWEHASRETGTPMRFSVYIPPAAAAGPVPLVWWLSGLTCNEQNFIIKSGFQRYASELGLMVVGPDTSPRGPALDGSAVAGDPDGSGEIGPSAGYYLDATQPPWAPHYRMRSYVERELPELVAARFPADMARQGMCGHSMGGHGALTVSLRNPGRFRSTSVLAPRGDLPAARPAAPAPPSAGLRPQLLFRGQRHRRAPPLARRTADMKRPADLGSAGLRSRSRGEPSPGRPRSGRPCGRSGGRSSRPRRG
jgi:S-formylglutathione hydrolase